MVSVPDNARSDHGASNVHKNHLESMKKYLSVQGNNCCCKICQENVQGLDTAHRHINAKHGETWIDSKTLAKLMFSDLVGFVKQGGLYCYLCNDYISKATHQIDFKALFKHIHWEEKHKQRANAFESFYAAPEEKTRRHKVFLELYPAVGDLKKVLDDKMRPKASQVSQNVQRAVAKSAKVVSQTAQGI